MHPLESRRSRSPVRRRLRPAKLVRAAPDRIARRRGGDECAVAPLEIGVQAMRLSPYRAGLAGLQRTRLLLPPAFPTCSCPLWLSPSGQSDGPEVFLRTSLDCVKDSAPRPAAHTFPATGSPRINEFRLQCYDWTCHVHRVHYRLDYLTGPSIDPQFRRHSVVNRPEQRQSPAAAALSRGVATRLGFKTGRDALASSGSSATWCLSSLPRRPRSWVVFHA
jgi:hypothetical protein